ncbi:lipopolysaccharide biosynthesis protein [Nocardiopsis lucentensis]|uniref:lipopolysaccharide biosynthesis protein n=1 Tax=Nocardiopsis lucentensis TaxID=53441 RepID=UPI00034CA1D5|nr:polysaccharide biosynthesis C-terminal domain-containing protein [Nocardiopsis lucentensis]
MGPYPLVAHVTATEDRAGAGLSRVLRGGVLNMAGAAVGAGLNLAVIVTITRAFSPETAGLLFSATSVFLIAATVAGAGAPDGLVYFITRLRVLGRAESVRRLLRVAMGPPVAAAGLLGVLMVLFAEPVARALATEDAETYLRLLAAFVPFAVMVDSALAATRAHHDMTATVLVDKVGRPLAQLALVAAVALSGSAGLLALAWAGPYLPAGVLAWFWLGRLLTRAAPAPRRGGAPAVTEAGTGTDAAPDTPDGLRSDGSVSPRVFWSFALPRAVAGVAQMGVQRGGVVLVALLSGLSGAAVFTAATRVMVLGQFGNQAVLSAAQPQFAEQLATGDHTGVRSLYQAGTAWLVCLTWPLYLSALVFAPQVMSLFGPGYAAGVTVLVVVCSGQLVGSALGMGDLILAMTGRSTLNLVNNVLALAANVLVCVALAPALGATGAAVALVASVVVRKVLPLLQLRKRVVLHPFGDAVMLAAGSAVIWFAALPLLTVGLLGQVPVALAVSIAVGAVGHLATVWRLRGHLGLRLRS